MRQGCTIQARLTRGILRSGSSSSSELLEELLSSPARLMPCSSRRFRNAAVVSLVWMKSCTGKRPLPTDLKPHPPIQALPWKLQHHPKRVLCSFMEVTE